MGTKSHTKKNWPLTLTLFQLAVDPLGGSLKKIEKKSLFSVQNYSENNNTICSVIQTFFSTATQRIYG